LRECKEFILNLLTAFRESGHESIAPGTDPLADGPVDGNLRMCVPDLAGNASQSQSGFDLSGGCPGSPCLQWGGVVLRVENNPGQTELTILETPLDFWGRPQGSAYGRGRFIAQVAKYLDPEVYGDKNRVVLAGEIVGEKIRPIDKIQYRYPVVRVSELHLFPVYDYPSRYYDQGGYEYWNDDQRPFRGIR
jgi:starvation-inducible outer membrane lipoprotein